MKRFRSGLAMSLCLSIIILFSSWGFLVHRTINQLAVYQLPSSIQPFFYEHIDTLVKSSVRPDERRNRDTTEAPKHFIDFEMYGDSAAWKMPHNWDSAVAIYTKDTLLEYGYVPYWIMEMKGKLTAAMRQSNKDSILFYAADLGHYIGDAHVPLHTSVNYDGQLSGQRGLHSLWESTIPELELTNYNLSGKRKAKYLRRPEEAVWQSVRQTHLLVKDVFAQEKEATKGFADSTKYRTQNRNGRDVKNYTTAFARAYSQRLGNTINQQLINSANLFADFLYTSWIDAGKPDLKKLDVDFSKSDKKQLKKEKRMYRENGLLKNSLLIARKNVTGNSE